ncbi:MAG: glycosyl hydrolase [Bacteroidota bacterium]
MRTQKLLIGSSKGLILFSREQSGWAIHEVHFSGMPVNMVYVDPISGGWWLGLAHHHWGPKLHRSTDQGKSWESVSVPSYPAGATLRPGKPAKLRKLWCMAQAGPHQPDSFWVGSEPGGLFITHDQGQNFQLVESLWNHPSRANPMQWFGTGRNEAFIHSIIVDPRDPAHLFVAVSCAGVFESLDGGKSWEACNKGLKAAYLPNPEAEVGHDPHLMLACQAQPDVIWQQNHCGIFRTTNGGKQWQEVSGKNQYPFYGFALAIDEQNPLRAWVIPAESDEVRQPKDLALQVCYTEDGGLSWQNLTHGLPQEHCFDLVFRHGLSKKASLMAFGTNNGNVYLSENEGQAWQLLSAHLARVNTLCFA